MILCQCAAVTQSTVEQVIREGASTVSDVARRCGAGRSCSPCRKEIAALLYRVGRSVQDVSEDAVTCAAGVAA